MSEPVASPPPLWLVETTHGHQGRVAGFILVDSLGVLQFYDRSGSTIAAYAPGQWISVERTPTETAAP